MMKEDSNHGTAKKYNIGCRCDDCKRAKSEYRKNSPIKKHGTKWSYDKGCRCEDCKLVKSIHRTTYYVPSNRAYRLTSQDGKSRTCAMCNITKPIEEFGKNSKRSLGKDYNCKICKNKRSQENKNTPEHRFSTYKSGARIRGIKFQISFEEFMSYWCKPCFYCGDSIDGIGLDRKDSDGSYHVGNIVPCCARCNRAKTIQTTDEFIFMCLKVAKRFEDHIVDPSGQK